MNDFILDSEEVKDWHEDCCKWSPELRCRLSFFVCNSLGVNVEDYNEVQTADRLAYTAESWFLELLHEDPDDVSAPANKVPVYRRWRTVGALLASRRKAAERTLKVAEPETRSAAAHLVRYLSEKNLLEGDCWSFASSAAGDGVQIDEQNVDSWDGGNAAREPGLTEKLQVLGGGHGRAATMQFHSDGYYPAIFSRTVTDCFYSYIDSKPCIKGHLTVTGVQRLSRLPAGVVRRVVLRTLGELREYMNSEEVTEFVQSHKAELDAEAAQTDEAVAVVWSLFVGFLNLQDDPPDTALSELLARRDRSGTNAQASHLPTGSRFGEKSAYIMEQVCDDFEKWLKENGKQNALKLYFGMPLNIVVELLKEHQEEGMTAPLDKQELRAFVSRNQAVLKKKARKGLIWANFLVWLGLDPLMNDEHDKAGHVDPNVKEKVLRQHQSGNVEAHLQPQEFKMETQGDGGDRDDEEDPDDENSEDEGEVSISSSLSSEIAKALHSPRLTERTAGVYLRGCKRWLSTLAEDLGAVDTFSRMHNIDDLCAFLNERATKVVVHIRGVETKATVAPRNLLARLHQQGRLQGDIWKTLKFPSVPSSSSTASPAAAAASAAQRSRTSTPTSTTSTGSAGIAARRSCLSQELRKQLREWLEGNGEEDPDRQVNQMSYSVNTLAKQCKLWIKEVEEPPYFMWDDVTDFLEVLDSQEGCEAVRCEDPVHLSRIEALKKVLAVAGVIGKKSSVDVFGAHASASIMSNAVQSALRSYYMEKLSRTRGGAPALQAQFKEDMLFISSQLRELGKSGSAKDMTLEEIKELVKKYETKVDKAVQRKQGMPKNAQRTWELFKEFLSHTDQDEDRDESADEDESHDADGGSGAGSDASSKGADDDDDEEGEDDDDDVKQSAAGAVFSVSLRANVCERIKEDIVMSSSQAAEAVKTLEKTLSSIRRRVGADASTVFAALPDLHVFFRDHASHVDARKRNNKVLAWLYDYVMQDGETSDDDDEEEEEEGCGRKGSKAAGVKRPRERSGGDGDDHDEGPVGKKRKFTLRQVHVWAPPVRQKFLVRLMARSELAEATAEKYCYNVGRALGELGGVEGNDGGPKDAPIATWEELRDIVRGMEKEGKLDELPHKAHILVAVMKKKKTKAAGGRADRQPAGQKRSLPGSRDDEEEDEDKANADDDNQPQKKKKKPAAQQRSYMEASVSDTLVKELMRRKGLSAEVARQWADSLDQSLRGLRGTGIKGCADSLAELRKAVALAPREKLAPQLAGGERQHLLSVVSKLGVDGDARAADNRQNAARGGASGQKPAQTKKKQTAVEEGPDDGSFENQEDKLRMAFKAALRPFYRWYNKDETLAKDFRDRYSKCFRQYVQFQYMRDPDLRKQKPTFDMVRRLFTSNREIIERRVESFGDKSSMMLAKFYEFLESLD